MQYDTLALLRAVRGIVHNVGMTNAAPTSQRDDLPAWVPSDLEFGTRLAMIRQKMQWNLSQAALECGLGQNDWARYEDGVKPRDIVAVADKISGRTGVDYSWLLIGVPSPPPVTEAGESPLSDSNRRPPLYIVGGSLEEAEWPAAEPKRKRVA